MNNKQTTLIDRMNDLLEQYYAADSDDNKDLIVRAIIKRFVLLEQGDSK